MASASTKFDLDKFDGTGDFTLWKEKMMAVLIYQKLDSAIEDDIPELKADASARKEDATLVMKQARSAIVMNLSDNVLRQVIGEKTASGLWKKLEQLYMTKTTATKIFLKGKFYGFKMNATMTLEQNFDEMNKIILSLSNMGEEIKEEDQVVILLNSLPDQFKELRTVIMYSRESLTLEDVMSALRSRDAEITWEKAARMQSQKQDESLIVRGRSPKRHTSRGPSRFHSRSKSRPKETRKCHHCGKVGHLIKHCWELKKKKKEEDNGNSSAVVDDPYSRDGDVCCVSLDRDTQEWILDTGCTYHMCPKREWFIDYKETNGGKVLMGNDHQCNVIGIGSIAIKGSDGTTKILNNVRHIPDLKRNLISLGTLDDEGYDCRVSRGILKITKGSLVVMKGIKKSGLYRLDGETVPPAYASVIKKGNSDSVAWHTRMGHISEQGLVELSKQGIIPNYTHVNLPFCEVCVQGKQHRIKFSSSNYRAKKPLEYIHSDLWGASRTPTQGGNLYFLSIVDDYSRKVWVYLLKNKSECLEKFKVWKTLVENQTNLKIKSLRTDNGLEFVNQEFNDLCAKYGIQRHKTVKNTPQQNGVAERMNRTLLNKVRCLMIESGLSKPYWGEALYNACYLINRSPSRVNEFMTPEEKWSSKKPSLNHIRTFGCVAYVHNVDDKLGKRSIKCVFLGYPDGVKGYRLLSLETYKIITSRDVIFNENVFPFKRNEKGISCDDAGQQAYSSRTQIEVQSADTGDSSVESGTEERDFAEGDQEEDLTSYQLARDRSRREIKMPARYVEAEADIIAYALAVMSKQTEPRDYKEAIGSKQSQFWKQAMIEEISSLKKNQTWVLVPKPEKQKVIGCKWVFKVKDGISQTDPKRFKARLVAKGFTQVEGIDYAEIFSPVIKMKTIRMMLALAVQNDWEIEQMDVKTTFLNGRLEETIYMTQPEGFKVEPKGEELVCLLKRSLYGLKQSPRQWYKRFDSVVTKAGYTRSRFDTCLYYIDLGTPSQTFLLIYVDDMLIMGNDLNKISKLKEVLNGEFEMKDMGAARKILGIDILRDRRNHKLILSQRHYLQGVLEKFNMSNGKEVNVPLGGHFDLSLKQSPTSEDEKKQMVKVPYAEAIGSLMYLMICTRLDIAYAVSVLSRFMSNPGEEHWKGVKWLLRYLKATQDYGLVYLKAGNKIKLEGFVDADYASNKDTRKSLTSYCFMLNECCINWKSQQQPIVALSTTEAEFMATTEAFKEAVWLSGILKEIKMMKERVTVYSDSQSSIHLCKNPVYHERSKHIDVRLFWIRDKIEEGTIDLEKVPSEENPADAGTKVLTRDKFLHCLKLMNIGPG